LGAHSVDRLEDIFRPLVKHFIQLLKKESMRSNTYFSSLPADLNVFINRAKAAQIPSPEDVMILRFVARMRRDTRLHQPIIAWIHQALTFSARSSATLKPEATVALPKELFQFVKVLSQQNCQAELSAQAFCAKCTRDADHSAPDLLPMELLGRMLRERGPGIAQHEVLGGVRERPGTGAVRCCSADLLMSKKVGRFRKYAFEELSREAKEVAGYLDRSVPKPELELVFIRVLLVPDEIDDEQLAKTVFEMVSGSFHRGYKPLTFLHSLNVFFECEMPLSAFASSSPSSARRPRFSTRFSPAASGRLLHI
jgi:hypothetical protein